MSNKTAQQNQTLSFTGPTNQAASASVQVAAPYQALSEGAWDVDASTGAGASFSIPFGAVSNVTGVLIKNGLDADVLVTVNGGGFTVKPGGALSMFSPGTSAPTTPIATIALQTEASTVLAGTVGFFLFGDPT